MEFGLSQEQEFLRDTLTRFLADNAGLPRARKFADGNERRADDVWKGLVELGVPHDRVNVHGGAISLGHPIGCSGARILVTLISALRDRGRKLGVAAICLGGGEGLAACVELL